ncbi:MAG: hypothetical protein C0425_06010 [Chlorobiaceae bacterium]|nr:hypothetical protein [Chlorobiaceae bacterium]MBA4309874.1 hypothetical protein [Chlorobiaceae bacterium]
MYKSSVSILLLLLLVLPGCLNYEQEVSLYPDGSGDMKIKYWMEFTNRDNIELLSKVGIFNSDSIRSQFTHEDVRIKDIVVVTDTVDSLLRAEIHIQFEHIDSLNHLRLFYESNFSLKEGAAGQLTFSQFIPPIAIGFGIDASDFKVKYIYEFPGEIVTHNATQVTKKQLIWEYSLPEIGKGKTISATYRPFKLKETPYWIYILSGVVLFIVIVFLFRKKRTW